MYKLNILARTVIAVASISLLVCYFVPVWAIYLFAPQYPEGLEMKIWLTHLTGDIDIINGLNHYIGMKAIKAEMFPEFSFLIYVMAFYIVLGLIIALNANLTWLGWYIVFTIFGGTFALFDFYRWGYEYGHNLDPNAAIKVPGLSYQPPLIGHKRLLNFDAYSYPDVGGWIVIAVAVIFILIWLSSYFAWGRKMFFNMAKISFPFLLLTISSCNVEPVPLTPGKDTCHACKMSIIDTRFGAELITKKGKILKFDDIGCMIHYMRIENPGKNNFQRILVSDYLKSNSWIDVEQAIFVQAESIHSPMNFNYAAFTDKFKIDSALPNTQVEIFDWQQINQRVNE